MSSRAMITPRAIMFCVNVNKDTDNNVKIVGFTAKQPLVEIVSKAESFDGAQSKLWRNSNKHTIADQGYADAVEFNHDEAQKSTIKFTWFLDQFGNLIGSVALDRSNYAVLKDIIWNVGRPGSAEATLISMVDGKEYTATVNTFDGFSAKEGQNAGYWMADQERRRPVSHQLQTRCTSVMLVKSSPTTICIVVWLCIALTPTMTVLSTCEESRIRYAERPAGNCR